MKKVNDFISAFHLSSSEDNVFVSRCSYWFAFILFTRFIRDGATIMFCSSKEHFGTMIDRKVYDITGDVTDSYEWVAWDTVDDIARRDILHKYIMF